jgi:hypothetical protein
MNKSNKNRRQFLKSAGKAENLGLLVEDKRKSLVRGVQVGTTDN